MTYSSGLKIIKQEMSQQQRQHLPDELPSSSSSSSSSLPPSAPASGSPESTESSRLSTLRSHTATADAAPKDELQVRSAPDFWLKVEEYFRPPKLGLVHTLALLVGGDWVGGEATVLDLGGGGGFVFRQTSMEVSNRAGACGVLAVLVVRYSCVGVVLSIAAIVHRIICGWCLSFINEMSGWNNFRGFWAHP